jgi:hypothetical protein
MEPYLNKMNYLAQKLNNPALGELGKKSGESFLQNLLTTAVTLCFVVGVLAFFFMLLMGALQWITSGGDKTSLEGARGRITSALIGLVILFCVFAIVKLIEGFFHIDILTLDIMGLSL